MRIMCIDPSSTQVGLALMDVEAFKDPVFLYGSSWEVKGDPTRLVMKCMEFSVRSFSAEVILFEDQFYGRTSNSTTTKKITIASGTILGALLAERFRANPDASKDVRIEYIYPRSWQTVLKGMPGESVKERSMSFANIWTGQHLGDDHIADAANMGYYYGLLLTKRAIENGE